MVDFIERLLDEAPESFNGTASTPAAKCLFEVNEQGVKLDEARALKFHNMVAKTLFLCKRARPDLQLVVGFLITRVKSPDEDDWKKLRRMIQYIRGFYDLSLTLEADKSRIIK